MCDRFDIATSIPAPGIAALTLRFLRAKKQKHIRATGLTSCWHRFLCVMIFTSGKAKIGTCDRPDTIAGIPASGIAALALQFLQAKKRKHVHATGLTSCWHSCPHVIIFTSGKAKTGTCNRPDIAASIPAASIAAFALQFLRAKKQKHVRATGLTSCWHSCSGVPIFTCKKAIKGMCNRLDRTDALALRFSRLGSKKRKRLRMY